MCFNLLTLEDGAPPLIPVWTWVGTLKAGRVSFNSVQTRPTFGGKKTEVEKVAKSLIFFYSILYIKNLKTF